MNCTKVQTRLGIAHGSLEAGDREQQIPQSADFAALQRPSSTTPVLQSTSASRLVSAVVVIPSVVILLKDFPSEMARCKT